MPSEEEMYSCGWARECAGWRKHLHMLKRPTPVTFTAGLLRQRSDRPRNCDRDINSSPCHRRYRRTANDDDDNQSIFQFIHCLFKLIIFIMHLIIFIYM